MSDKAKVSILKGKFLADKNEIDRMVREAIGLVGGLSGKIKKGDHVAQAQPLRPLPPTYLR